jgi:bacterioferritin
MKGNEKVLAVLNKALAEELTAISQYMVHSEMCDSWGYAKLHAAIEKQAIDEMKHAEKLIGRILFLEGLPIVSKLNPMKIGKDVPAMIANDKDDEAGAVQSYNEAIAICRDAGDQASADLFLQLLKDEEGHVDWGEEQLDQIAQMGVQNYLANQAG